MEQQDLDRLKSVVRPKSYVFTGRLHPERYEWGFTPSYEGFQVDTDGSSCLLKVTIIASQVLVTVDTNGNHQLLDMKNRVTTLVRNWADAMGHVAGAALDVEIIGCTGPDGSSHIFNTAFDGLIRHPVGSPESQRLFNSILNQTATSQ